MIAFADPYWREARIVYRCDGSEGSFALVQFDGADTQSVVRLEAMAEADVVGYLHSNPAASPIGTPAMVLTATKHVNDSK